MVESAKAEAILAFYNVFTEDLQLVECDSLADINFLLHSVTNFIVTGVLTYQSHENFGFPEAVKFLQKESVIDFGTLNARAAASGDEFEILKIKYLDSLEENAPRKREQWQQCLAQVPPDVDLDIALFTDELTDPLLSLQCDTATDSDIGRVRSRRSISPLVAALVGGVNDGSCGNGAGGGSSVRSVSGTALCTPKKSRRSSTLSRVKQSERRISELREQLQLAGRELDVCQERREALEAELDVQVAACKNLQSRLISVNAEREELKRELARSACETMLTRQELAALEERHRVDSERHAADAERARVAVEALRAELECALVDAQKSRTLRDAIERQTEKYMKVAENEQLLQFRIRELRELVASNERRHRHCISQKCDEFAAQLRLAEQVKENYARRVRELEAALLADAARSCSSVDECEDEITGQGVRGGGERCRTTAGQHPVDLQSLCLQCHTFNDGSAKGCAGCCCSHDDDVSVDQLAFFSGTVTTNGQRLAGERLISLYSNRKKHERTITTTSSSQAEDAEGWSGSDDTETEDDAVERWVEDSRRRATLSATRLRTVKDGGGDECDVKNDGAEMSAMNRGKVMAAVGVTAVVSATLAFLAYERLRTP